MKRKACAGGASLGLLLLAGCGLAANPQPPTLWLPAPPRDVAAARVGNEVRLHWTMPKETTDKVTLKGEQMAHICWTDGAVAAGKSNPPAAPVPSTGLPGCHAAGDGKFPPEKPASYKTQLPVALLQGAPRAVSYFVELENHAGKTAGPSNPGWVAAGAAPTALVGLRLETRAEGVVLRWQAAAPQAGLVLRIHRELVTKAGGPKRNEANGAPPVQGQVLEVDLDKRDPGQALDSDATLDRTWKYTAERVLRVNLEHHALEIAGEPSQALTIDAKDVFPPAVPEGLAVVVDEEAGVLDLSWTPDADTDLAGYVVYRRDVTAGTATERISGRAVVVPPSFEDKNVQAGHRYAYAVSAVDLDGNESARSGEVEEGLAQ